MASLPDGMVKVIVICALRCSRFLDRRRDIAQDMCMRFASMERRLGEVR